MRRAVCLVPAVLLVALNPVRGTAQRESTAVRAARPIVIASKPFGESYLLAELFAQLLEARGIAVDRRFGFGATELAFKALVAGDIDLYPEYTGTGVRVILRDTTPADARTTFDRAAREFRTRYDLRWLPPLGFENTYAIAVRRVMADSLGLHSLSDLARASGRLRAGLTPDFIGRADGLPGIVRAYGLAFRDVRALAQSVKYRALVEGAVDVVDGYSTDGFLARDDLIALEDDRRFFPPYEAAGLLRGAIADARPDVVATISVLSGRLDAARMRRWNARLETAGAAIPDVARDALVELGLAPGSTATGRSREEPPRESSWIAYAWNRRGEVASLTRRHLLLVAVSLAAAVLVALPLALVLSARARLAEGIIRGVGTIQTIPGMALLAFFIPLLGIGVWPALVALFVYSLYPIVRNTYSGVRDADPSAVDAASALGMTSGQVLRYVRLPLAAPTIMAGIRTAAVLNVGTATLAAFVGAGGLGEPIVTGLALADSRRILLGAIPAAALALVADLALGALERVVRPRR